MGLIVLVICVVDGALCIWCLLFIIMVGLYCGLFVILDCLRLYVCWLVVGNCSLGLLALVVWVWVSV